MFFIRGILLGLLINTIIMQPTPTPIYKKLLLPGLIIIGLILVGTLLFMNGGVVTQGASLFKGISTINVNTSVCKITVGPTGLPSKPVPSVKVISPNGGETFTAGQQITVKWSSCGIPATGNVISIQLRGGFPGSAVNFMELAPSNYSVNDGSETITLPTQAMNSFMQYGNNFRIKVWIEGYAQDESDNFFTINGPIASCANGDPLITSIGSPIKGGTLNRGGNMTVSWNWCNIHPESEVLIVLKDVNSNQRYSLSTYNYSSVFPGSSTGNYHSNTLGASDLVTIPSYIPTGQYEVWVGGKVYPDWNPDFLKTSGTFTVK